MDKVSMTKNKNRRVFFRIYDEVNLFYQKIDEKLIAEPYPVTGNMLADFSSSTDLESLYPGAPAPEKKPPELHQTHHVNISAGGMAFDCDDTFKEDDYLIIKIMLLSTMAVIVTYCKVVYCKDIQTNDSQHPCFVGVHFVNMKDEDRSLLNSHVAKRRLQNKWLNGFILAAVITVLAAPGAVFGLLGELLHFLFELFTHILHLSFEFIESNLDHLIEHLFHTDLHQTQIIVFYVIFAVAVYGLYRLWRGLPSFGRRCKEKLFAVYAYKKASLSFFWREQTLFDKIKLVVIGAAAVAGYIYFGM